MIGHSDVTKDGKPVGRIELDTDKATITVHVLESCSVALVTSILSAAIPPKGFKAVFKVIKDGHFFDLFT